MKFLNLNFSKRAIKDRKVLDCACPLALLTFQSAKGLAQSVMLPRTSYFLKLLPAFLFLGTLSIDAANVTINMTGFQFAPKNLTVNVGDTVIWVNQDFALHNTVSGTGGVPNGIWQSPLFGNGGSFSFTFNVAPGAYPYFCTPHVANFNMVGTITVAAPNAPPSVSITNPPNGAKFTRGANILIEASASDDSGVAHVEFYVDGNLIATDFSAPYSTLLTNVALGNYSLAATAFDAEGLSATSAVVNISALNSPTIAITQPVEGAKFGLGTNILVAAEVTVAGLAATTVQFFESDGTNFQTISPPLTNAPYNFLWLPDFARTHRLQAIVTDEAGGATPSTFVNIEVFEPGTENPTIAITDSPPNFSRATNSTLFIGGVANDDIRLDYVEFQVNGGPFLRANGTSNWIAQVGLIPGTNVVSFRSVDFAGNYSTNDTRMFTYVLNSPTVLIRGLGTVAPNLDGKLLELGKFYQMIARPGPGQIFGGWEGATISNKAVLNFVMDSNLVLTANFIPNPFPDVKGIYTGLFFETDNPQPESSGIFKLKVTARGAFSGKLTMQRNNYPMRGQLDHSGRARIPVLRRPIRPVVVTLNLNLEGTNEIIGEVTNGEWISELRGGSILPTVQSRSIFPNGAHLFNLTNNEDNLAGGTVQLGATIKIRGRFSSEESFGQTLFPIENSQFPMCVFFNGGNSVVLGWLDWDDSPAWPLVAPLIFATTNSWTNVEITIQGSAYFK